MVRIVFPRLLPVSKQTIIVGGVLLVGGATVVLYGFSRDDTVTAPTYDVVLPQRRSVEDLGGWQRISPTDKDPVFAYSDEIDETLISVSQQPVPESFKDNVAGHVKQLADSYSATTVIEAGGTQVYIGRSARGPQSVIFTKNNVLVLIKSQKTISQTAWISYINNLVDPKNQQTPTF